MASAQPRINQIGVPLLLRQEPRILRAIRRLQMSDHDLYKYLYNVIAIGDIRP